MQNTSFPKIPGRNFQDVTVKHFITSIKHLQMKGYAEVANRAILKALHTRHDKSKGMWKEELPKILWAYHY